MNSPYFLYWGLSLELLDFDFHLLKVNKSSFVTSFFLSLSWMKVATIENDPTKFNPANSQVLAVIADAEKGITFQAR